MAMIESDSAILAAIIAVAESDLAGDFEDAEASGQRPDTWGCEVALTLDHARGLSAEIARLTRERDEARAALREVMGWIENWSPDFEDDEEWRDTCRWVRAALGEGGE